MTEFNELVGCTIISVDASAVNTVILTVQTIAGNTKYYWIDSNGKSLQICELSTIDMKELDLEQEHIDSWMQANPRITN